jgi:hypothetical protein
MKRYQEARKMLKQVQQMGLGRGGRMGRLLSKGLGRLPLMP